MLHSFKPNCFNLFKTYKNSILFNEDVMIAITYEEEICERTEGEYRNSSE